MSMLVFVSSLAEALLLVAAALMLLWLVFLTWPGLFNGPPFVVSKAEKIAALVEIADIRSGELAVDLGCGDGRLLLPLAQRGAQVVGYDINLFLIWKARWVFWRAGLAKRSRFYWRDMYKADLSAADLIVFYGYAPIMEQMKRKLSVGLKPGVRIVSLAYRVPGWEPRREVNGVFLYAAPAAEESAGAARISR